MFTFTIDVTAYSGSIDEIRASIEALIAEWAREEVVPAVATPDAVAPAMTRGRMLGLTVTSSGTATRVVFDAEPF